MIKLYLSSYRLGNNPEQLQSLAGPNKRAAVISNACDHKDKATRDERTAVEIADLQQLGFQPEKIDLRNYFDKTSELEAILSQFGLIWVRGGNAFVLRKAMALSGFDTMIHSLLDSGMVYAGYSAGGCVVGPTLHGIELCDDPSIIPAGYPAEPIWDGIGLIDYTVVPHYKSDHPESAMIDDVVAYYEEHNLPYKTLHDGEVILVNS